MSIENKPELSDDELGAVTGGSGIGAITGMSRYDDGRVGAGVGVGDPTAGVPTSTTPIDMQAALANFIATQGNGGNRVSMETLLTQVATAMRDTLDGTQRGTIQQDQSGKAQQLQDKAAKLGRG
jgi:hypothetical protein